MRIIVDSNRIISALIKDGLTRKILISKNIDFYTIDYVIDEIRRYKDYIMKKSKMDEEEIELLFDLVMQNVNIIPEEDIRKHMDKAIKIMKDIDINDSPILASALSFSNEGIWSEDKDLYRQDKVKIWKTTDLKRYI